MPFGYDQAMTQIQLTLPEDEADWLAAQAAAVGLTPEALVIKMVAQERAAIDALKSLLAEGMASGDYLDPDEAYFAELRAKVAARTAAE